MSSENYGTLGHIVVNYFPENNCNFMHQFPWKVIILQLFTLLSNRLYVEYQTYFSFIYIMGKRMASIVGMFHAYSLRPNCNFKVQNPISDISKRLSFYKLSKWQHLARFLVLFWNSACGATASLYRTTRVDLWVSDTAFARKMKSTEARLDLTPSNVPYTALHLHRPKSINLLRNTSQLALAGDLRGACGAYWGVTWPRDKRVHCIT